MSSKLCQNLSWILSTDNSNPEEFKGNLHNNFDFVFHDLRVLCAFLGWS